MEKKTSQVSVAVQKIIIANFEVVFHHKNLKSENVNDIYLERVRDLIFKNEYLWSKKTLSCIHMTFMFCFQKELFGAMNFQESEISDFLSEVLIQSAEREDLKAFIVKLEKCRLFPGYFRWFPEIYALLLAFNLNEMSRAKYRQFSFKEISRPHSNFDKRFAEFVLKKVPGLNHQDEYRRLLTRKCKSKFLTMKRNFQRNKCQNYSEFIPSESKRMLNESDYPVLKKALTKYEKSNLKDNIQNDQEPNFQELSNFISKDLPHSPFNQEFDQFLIVPQKLDQP